MTQLTLDKPINRTGLDSTESGLTQRK
jgi:hypothetical protein